MLYSRLGQDPLPAAPQPFPGNFKRAPKVPYKPVTFQSTEYWRHRKRPRLHNSHPYELPQRLGRAKQQKHPRARTKKTVGSEMSAAAPVRRPAHVQVPEEHPNAELTCRVYRASRRPSQINYPSATSRLLDRPQRHGPPISK
ncbi:hypothetical protein METBIDRAFT_32038 [Metschnikowia bicuspidata var. bicuspidata NRRL YB-4993]|uniref:Uncharacterized protein n=1 Tax=Metschnikowia bicuspidata var. bicuspidata NRRL YB-4993 TaxID=869754 RepID=A0A1A0HCC5_9ASCO|nr:hypothetical protein METBIDRAFT_32038 [Metschnikowia bicuspidata var. bicuspidata NRRL YB-4993]OBA21527.1 hypothetical protein METBIDRAFT_32038 [Metschnikowia bicuspidata var. bicuspidata NRRL YB-4993]